MAVLEEIEALVALARGGSLKPLVLIFGDQDHLVRQAYDRVLEALVPVELRDFNLEQHDGAQVEMQNLVDSLATPPMLSGPKAVGVYDARFFQSKASATDLLAKAKERWIGGDATAGLRQLGRVLALADLGWDDAAQGGLDGLAQALELSPADLAKAGGPWLAEALARGQSSGLAKPSAADDSGELCAALELQMGQGPAVASLVCAAISADSRKRLTKLFAERGHVLDCRSSVKAAEVNQTARAFMAKRLKDKGLTLKSALGERIAAAYGHDLGLLDKELDKLEAWAFPRVALEDADLLAVGSPRPEEEVYILLDALAKKDLAGSLKLLRRFLAADPEARFSIFGLLSSELRKLLRCRALMDQNLISGRGPQDYNSFKMQTHPKLAKELPTALAAWWKKANAYATYQALLRARSFDTVQLTLLIRSLSLADAAMKSGQADPEAVLEEACLALCGAKEEVLL